MEETSSNSLKRTIMTEEDKNILFNECSIEQIRSLYYYSALSKEDCQEIMLKMFEAGKDYRGLIPDDDGNVWVVENKNGKTIKPHKLEGFKLVRGA
jgi:hypothetical protein